MAQEKNVPGEQHGRGGSAHRAHSWFTADSQATPALPSDGREAGTEVDIAEQHTAEPLAELQPTGLSESFTG